MVKEKDLKPPFKNQFTEWLNDEWPDAQVVEWENEYSAKADERSNWQAPSTVIERIDLVCKTEVENSPDIHYVVEIKQNLNKKAVGQALMYYYAYNRDLVIRADNPDKTEYPMVFPVIGFQKWKEHYIDWLDFMDGLLTDDFQIIRMSIDYSNG